MRHVYQGEDPDCVLAVIAMLADVDLEAARDKAKEIAPEWCGWHTTMQKYPMLPTVLAGLLGVNVDITHREENRLPLPSDGDIDLSGRGQLSVGFGRWIGHSVAFEDGWIFNPQYKIRMPLRFNQFVRICALEGLVLSTYRINRVQEPSRIMVNGSYHDITAVQSA